MTNSSEPNSYFHRLRVLEINASLGRYVGTLFADEGALVLNVRLPNVPVEPPVASEEILPTGEGTADIFLDERKINLIVNTDADGALDFLRTVAHRADVVITSLGHGKQAELGIASGQLGDEAAPQVHASVTAFGLTGPDAGAPASDLTLLARGGLLSLAGEPDLPIMPVGRQPMYMASLHAWNAILAGLLAVQRSNQVLAVDVSAQQAIAYSLENAIQTFDLEGINRERKGAEPSEAGTGLYECADGMVYIVGGLAGAGLGWERLARWLAQFPSGEELLAPEWAETTYRSTPEARKRFAEVFSKTAGTRTKEEIYEDGQAYGVSIAPVARPQEVLANRQLIEREYFRDITTAGGAQVTVPGLAARRTQGESTVVSSTAVNQTDPWIARVSKWLDCEPFVIADLVGSGLVRACP